MEKKEAEISNKDESVLELDAADVCFFMEALAAPLETPQKEAPNLYQAIRATRSTPLSEAETSNQEYKI